MKHIRKSFLNQKDLGEAEIKEGELEIVEIKEDFDSQTLRKYKNQILTFHTDQNILIEGFAHNVDGNYYMFPIPDPTLIYFHTAQISLKSIKPAKKKLLEKLGKNMSEGAINEVFNFYSITSSFVIFLFTSIESFINQQIPDTYLYRKIADTKRAKTITEYSKQQIQEYIDFMTKMKIILSEATGKDYFKHSTANTQHIINLKDFRDGIIHTKDTGTPIKYDFFVQKALSFKYLETLLAVASFMNFYRSNYIVECDCGQDY